MAASRPAHLLLALAAACAPSAAPAAGTHPPLEATLALKRLGAGERFEGCELAYRRTHAEGAAPERAYVTIEGSVSLLPGPGRAPRLALKATSFVIFEKDATRVPVRPVGAALTVGRPLAPFKAGEDACGEHAYCVEYADTALSGMTRLAAEHWLAQGAEVTLVAAPGSPGTTFNLKDFIDVAFPGVEATTKSFVAFQGCIGEAMLGAAGTNPAR